MCDVLEAAIQKTPNAAPSTIVLSHTHSTMHSKSLSTRTTIKTQPALGWKVRQQQLALFQSNQGRKGRWSTKPSSLIRHSVTTRGNACLLPPPHCRCPWLYVRPDVSEGEGGLGVESEALLDHIRVGVDVQARHGAQQDVLRQPEPQQHADVPQQQRVVLCTTTDAAGGSKRTRSRDCVFRGHGRTGHAGLHRVT